METNVNKQTPASKPFPDDSELVKIFKLTSSPEQQQPRVLSDREHDDALATLALISNACKKFNERNGK